MKHSQEKISLLIRLYTERWSASEWVDKEEIYNGIHLAYL